MKLFNNKMLIGSLVGIVLLSTISLAAKNNKKSDTVERLVLQKKNTLSLKLPVTEQTVSHIQQQVIEMSNTLSKTDTIYLYLDSPGGDVVAGMALISTLKGLPQEVKTITSFSASMAFITVQSLGERLILNNGILMSHRMTMGEEGQTPGEFNVRSLFFEDIGAELAQMSAKRMGLNFETYQNLVHDEYWVKGSRAVKANAADKVVNVSCSADLSGTHEESLQTFMGSVTVTFSNCPLVVAPLNVDFSGFGTSYGASEFEVDKVKRTIYEAIVNKKEFVNDEVIQQNYFKYVK